MAKPIVYKKDIKYNVSYINKNGETKNIEYTPEEDLSIAKIITNIKEENSDYLKLVSIEESKSIKKEKRVAFTTLLFYIISFSLRAFYEFSSYYAELSFQLRKREF